MKKSKKNIEKKESYKILFKPNLNPRQIFSLGSFGGTYWRDIKHKGKIITNQHRKYKWKIADEKMTLDTSKPKD